MVAVPRQINLCGQPTRWEAANGLVAAPRCVDGGDVVFYRVNSVFYECRQQLGRLTRLRLHGDSYCPVIFSILLR